MKFVDDSTLNYVEMSFGDSNVNGYDKYPIRQLSVSMSPGFERLFYKYKVMLTDAQRSSVLKTLSSSKREYEVVGLEILSRGEVNPTDYPVMAHFVYEGYSKGYGPNEDSDTLRFTRSVSEGIDIDELKQTFFRPSGSMASGTFRQSTLASVYFAVPNKYFELYDYLSAIRMQWLKARTQWGFVTGNKTVYNELLPWVGVNEFSTDPGLMTYKNENGGGLPTLYGFEGIKDNQFKATVTFNRKTDFWSIPCLAYLFGTDNWAVNSADNYVLSAEEILDWMRNYHDTYDHDRVYHSATGGNHLSGQPDPGRNCTYKTPYGGELLTVDGVTYNYSRALFSDYLDHVTKYDLTWDKTYSLQSHHYTLNRSWWLDTFNWTLGYDGEWTKEDWDRYEEFDGIQGIVEVDPDRDLYGSNDEVANRLFIDKNDVGDFMNYCGQAKASNMRVILARFDVGEYEAAEAREGKYFEKSLTSGWDDGDTNARVFQMDVWLNLDIIHLEFDDGGKRVVIPVVSTPIDVVTDGTPAIVTTSDERWLLFVIIFGVIGIGSLVAGIVFFKNRNKTRNDSSKGGDSV